MSTGGSDQLPQFHACVTSDQGARVDALRSSRLRNINRLKDTSKVLSTVLLHSKSTYLLVHTLKELGVPWIILRMKLIRLPITLTSSLTPADQQHPSTDIESKNTESAPVSTLADIRHYSNPTQLSTMTSTLFPPNPSEVMVIRKLTPEVVTLSLPFSRFGRLKFGARGTLGKHCSIPNMRQACIY